MIQLFIRHPTLANLLMLSFFVLGLSSLSNIKRETFPEFSSPYITALLVYPGASPSEVEQSLCLRMEDAVDGLNNIEEVKCDAQEGSALLTIKLNEQADMGRSLIDVQTQISAINDFPSDVESPIVKELDWSEPVIDIAISGNTSATHLKAYAEDLKRRLKVQAGVGLITVAGFSDHYLQVSINAIDMRRLGLSITDIANIISQNNIKMPIGNLELSDKNFLIRFDERKITAAKIADIVITSNTQGSIVKLKDIATIEDTFTLDEEQIIFNGQPAAILKIKKNKADDALRIKEKVYQFIDKEQQLAPQGIYLTLTNDMSSLLQDRLSMLLRNGWQGIILAFLSLWLFFSFRYSFWVCAGLPVAFLGGLFLMSLFSISINVMTLVGLLMAIGIMMDDAIVLSESIAAHLEKGLSIEEAVSKGVIKVAPGVLSSFMTTIFIFGSLLWLQGQMGQVLSAVPMVLIMVLSISLIEAFLILPYHLNHSLNNKKAQRPPVKFKRIFLQRFEYFRNHILVKMVTFVVQWRYISLGGTLAILLISVSLLTGGVLKFLPFPELDGDIAEARIILPPGSTLQQTKDTVAMITSAAQLVADKYSQNNNEPSHLIKDITVQYNFNRDAAEKGPHIATVRLDLLSARIRNTLIDNFITDWRSQTGDNAQAISLVFKQPQMGPAGRDIEVRLQHDNLSRLKSAAIDLQSYLGQFSGVNGIADNMRPGKEEIIINLKAGAENHGVTSQYIATQLRSAYYGQTADEIQIGPENISIHVRLDKQQAGDLNTLNNFPIMLGNGQQISLSSVANITFQRSFVRIQRINSQRSITIMADIDNSRANGSEIVSKLRSEFLPILVKNHPGLLIDFEGSTKESQKTGSSLLKGFLIGLFGVFVILSLQFRSYIEPLIVMLAIPLALIGVFWGHIITGHNLSMPSILGFISLAGIVVNDSILLVQYIRHHMELGEKVAVAVVNASRDRFRAVFLTSLTTAAGLLPLLLETSLQAQVVKPIVISIVFGIFASTLLVLFIIPCAYAALAAFGLLHRHQKLQRHGL